MPRCCDSRGERVLARCDQAVEARFEVGRDLKQCPALGADQVDVPLAHDQPGDLDLDLAGELLPAAEALPQLLVLERVEHGLVIADRSGQGVQLDPVRDRLGEMIGIEAEHEQTIDEALSQAMWIRALGGVTRRSMSFVWALNDYRPGDGGPSLMARYAERPELTPPARAIARGLTDARLDVYQVGATVPGLWLELAPLRDNAPVRLGWQDGFERVQIGEILLARVVHATTMPTVWGLGAYFPAGSQRRWQARLAALPTDPAEAALLMLSPQPRDHVIDQLVTSAQLARDEFQPLKTTALELLGATARARIVTRRHAAQAMSATGRKFGERRRSRQIPQPRPQRSAGAATNPVA